jgi:N-acetylglucosaminyl-diphospho-decaprenol L-rhamnosyltransferase
MDGTDDRTSVVMITMDRRDEADTALCRLAQLPERPPVIVVDNGSTDGTAQLVRRRHPDVLLLEPGRNLAAAGRTPGVRAATTPYVAFCDDDTWWEPDALRRAADLLDAHPTLGLVAAHILVGDAARDDPVCAAMADSPLQDVPGVPGRPVLGFLAGMAVVRREAYLAAGGFLPEVGVGGEEAWLAADLAAAGWRLAYVPQVVARHRPSTARDRRARARRDLRNALWFTWTRRRTGRLRRSVRLVRATGPSGDTAAALAQAVRGAGWVRRNRRPVPPAVDADLALLDDTS